jgi:ApaG protein
MAQSFEKLENLRVSIDHVVFSDQVGDPPLRPYGFVYFITIHNESPYRIQLLARKWIVKEGNGNIVVVEGEGIVGEKPILQSGEGFSYNSCHVVASNAVASGAFYGMMLKTKKFIMVEIPEFKLEIC